MKKEYRLALLVILIWGSGPALIKLLIGGMDDLVLTIYTNLAATLFLFGINGCTGRLKKLKELSFRSFGQLICLGLLGMGFYNLFLFGGLKLLQAQQATVINYLWPVFIVLFSCLILHEKMTVHKLIAFALSFFGVIIVATKGDVQGLFHMSFAGIITCVLSALCYGLFSVLNLKVTCDKFLAMMVYYGSATIILFLWALLNGTSFVTVSVLQFSGIVWIGAIVNGLAYTFWAMALDIGDTARISNLAFLTPVVSLGYIFFLLHESLHPATFVGMALILGGIVLQHSGNRS